MHHQRRAHARAGVGGAGGEIAKLGIEAERAYAFQKFLRPESLLGRLGQGQAGYDRLNTQMILLVDHDADAQIVTDQRSANLAVFKQVAADQMLLHQRHPFHLGHSLKRMKHERALARIHRLARPVDTQLRVFRVAQI